MRVRARLDPAGSAISRRHRGRARARGSAVPVGKAGPRAASGGAWAEAVSANGRRRLRLPARGFPVRHPIPATHLTMRSEPSDFQQFEQVHAALQDYRALAKNDEERDYRGGLVRFIYRVSREEVARQSVAVVFRPVGERWEIGEEGATQPVTATTVGVALAHRILGGERPIAVDGAARAVRVLAAAWARRAGCPRLETVLRAHIAQRQGHLEYLPGPHAPRLLLC